MSQRREWLDSFIVIGKLPRTVLPMDVVAADSDGTKCSPVKSNRLFTLKISTPYLRNPIARPCTDLKTDHD